jgi:hypothetical protein
MGARTQVSVATDTQVAVGEQSANSAQIESLICTILFLEIHKCFSSSILDIVEIKIDLEVKLKSLSFSEL